MTWFPTGCLKSEAIMALKVCPFDCYIRGIAWLFSIGMARGLFIEAFAYGSGGVKGRHKGA